MGSHDVFWHNRPVLLARRPAMPRPFASTVDLPDPIRDQLEALVRARSTPQALAFRCRIVLRAGGGHRPCNQENAAGLGCNRHPLGVGGLSLPPRPGARGGQPPLQTGSWRPTGVETATPWASGANASSPTAWRACRTSRAPADPGAFPPSERAAVVCIATSKTED